MTVVAEDAYGRVRSCIILCPNRLQADSGSPATPDSELLSPIEKLAPWRDSKKLGCFKITLSTVLSGRQ